MEAIQYVGAKDLDDSDKRILDNLSSEYYGKIQRKIDAKTSLVIQLKSNSKLGSKKKWSVHIRLSSPKGKYEAKKAHDWDFARTLHKGFNDILDQIKNKPEDKATWNKARAPSKKQKDNKKFWQKWLGFK